MCRWTREINGGWGDVLIGCINGINHTTNFVDTFVYCPFCGKEIERIDKKPKRAKYRDRRKIMKSKNSLKSTTNRFEMLDL